MIESEIIAGSDGPILFVRPSTTQLDAIQAVLQGDGGVTSDGFATGPIPAGFDDPADGDRIILSLGGITSDGTVIPTSLHIENRDHLAPFQQTLRDVGIDNDVAFDRLIKAFDQNRNGNLQAFDPNDPALEEVAELFAGTDLLAAIGAGQITVLALSTNQADVIRASLATEGGITSDGFAAGPLPDALEDIENPDRIVLSLGGTTSDGTVLPPALLVQNLDRLEPFQDAVVAAGVDDDVSFDMLTRIFEQIRDGNLQAFDAGTAGDVTSLFEGTDLLDGVAMAEMTEMTAVNGVETVEKVVEVEEIDVDVDDIALEGGGDDDEDSAFSGGLELIEFDDTPEILAKRQNPDPSPEIDDQNRLTLDDFDDDDFDTDDITFGDDAVA